MDTTRTRHAIPEYSVWGVVVASALVAIRYSLGYPIFHTLAELFTISVAIGTFMVTWNARRYIDNGYLVFLGIAYFFVAAVDGLHMLAYQGVETFSAYSSTELPTQLWLIARYVQSAALIIAPMFAGKRFRANVVFAAFASLTLTLVVLVFSGHFPSALPASGELTPFKIWSEWLVISAFVIGLVGLLSNRRSFDPQVLRLLAGSIIASITAEFAFTLYVTPVSLENMGGHLLRILAFYLLYRAIVETGILRPYAVLFHELTETSERLRESEVRFRSTFEQATVGIAHISLDGRLLLANRRLGEITGHSLESLRQIRPSGATHSNDQVAEEMLVERLLAGELSEPHLEKRFVRPDGSLVWVSVSRSIVRNDSGSPRYIVAIIEDITVRKDAEQRLYHARDLGEALNAIDRAINSTFDLDEVMRRVTSLGVAVIGADAATVWIEDHGRWIPRLAHGYPDLIINQRFTDREVPHVAEAIRLDEPLAIEDLPARYPDSSFAAARDHNVTSALAIPLQFRSEHFGALTFVWRQAHHEFTTEEHDFARKLGSALALAMENARLYAGERLVADTLQTSMLRIDSDVSGLELAWAYRSATELAQIGGDFFDLFKLQDNRVAFVIGDVSGKGIEAAAITSVAKSTLRAFAYELQDPALVARAANRTLALQVEEGRFITMLYGVVDLASGDTTIVCAGHPLPLICDQLGCTEHATTRNPPLAVFGEHEFETYSVHLHPRQRLIMYSDGLIDTRRGGEFLGEDRVLELVDELGDADPQVIADTLMEAAWDFAVGTPDDDIAIVVFRYLGLGES